MESTPVTSPTCGRTSPTLNAMIGVSSMGSCRQVSDFTFVEETETDLINSEWCSDHSVKEIQSNIRLNDTMKMMMNGGRVYMKGDGMVDPKVIVKPRTHGFSLRRSHPHGPITCGQVNSSFFCPSFTSSGTPAHGSRSLALRAR